MSEEGESARPVRLMNFVSEDQLDESKKTRGARVEDGTYQRDRPLFEILRENKDKKDAEFNERFKHRPPKALDEDETEFLDNLEMSKKEYERQMADEEIEQLQSFQAAVAAQASIVHEIKEASPPPLVQEKHLPSKKNPPTRPLGVIIKVHPKAKKAKLDTEARKELPDVVQTSNRESQEPQVGAKIGLVSYSDESEEDD